jgi:hypothetical protein
MSQSIHFLQAAGGTVAALGGLRMAHGADNPLTLAYKAPVPPQPSTCACGAGRNSRLC